MGVNQNTLRACGVNKTIGSFEFATKLYRFAYRGGGGLPNVLTPKGGEGLVALPYIRLSFTLQKAIICDIYISIHIIYDVKQVYIICQQ